MQEIRIALQPKQKLFRESIRDNYCTAFGGARGGGKSYALRNIFLIRRLEYPGSIGVIFRKSFPELHANHIQPMFDEHPGLRQYWNESKKILSLPNGSVLQFSHCSNEIDVALHQGKEWHDFGFDEAGQITEKMFRTLQGSNRSSKPGIPARTAISLNPAGIGHSWVKRLFIDRRFNDRERPEDYHFIQSLIKDNPALLQADPDYVHRLNAEPSEVLRRAYLYGDWDLQAGAFFGELSRDVHFIKPFTIPKHWLRFGAFDFGFNHPGAFGWFANDEDGNTYLYREFVRAGLRADQFAAELLKHEDTAELDYIVAGHDCWSDRGVSSKSGAPTVAEEFNSHKIYLSKANIGRIQGANQVRNYLAWRGTQTGKPRFYIFNTCPITFDCLTRMEHDVNRAEDVLKVDAVEGDPMTGDDAYDLVRYGLMSRPSITTAPKFRHKYGTPGWAEEEAKRMEEHVLDEYTKQQEIEEGIRLPDDPWSKNPSSFDGGY